MLSKTFNYKTLQSVVMFMHYQCGLKERMVLTYSELSRLAKQDRSMKVKYQAGEQHICPDIQHCRLSCSQDVSWDAHIGMNAPRSLLSRILV